jgi:hypothetical protein
LSCLLFMCQTKGEYWQQWSLMLESAWYHGW